MPRRRRRRRALDRSTRYLRPTQPTATGSGSLRQTQDFAPRHCRRLDLLDPGTSTEYATLRPSGDGLRLAILATGATVPALATSARFSPFASTRQRSIPVIALPGPPPSVNKRDTPSGNQAKSTTRRPASGVTTFLISPLLVSSMLQGTHLAVFALGDEGDALTGRRPCRVQSRFRQRRQSRAELARRSASGAISTISPVCNCARTRSPCGDQSMVCCRRHLRQRVWPEA